MKSIDELLEIATQAGASDLHVKVGSPPTIRVDGELQTLDEPACSPDDTKDCAASLMSEKQIRRFSETNEIDFAYSSPQVGRYRVNVYRQRGTISIACRQVVTRVPDFAELNLPAVVHKLALEPRGMVLVTGTTGSGKTTTLAAMIDHINRNLRRHIVTVEDPIEILHRDKLCIINQREVGLDTENYASALKYVLRQDPDIIFIGEMRDQETVRTALSAAQTGHFVLSTLHTIDATETVNRIIDFFPLYQQAAPWVCGRAGPGPGGRSHGGDGSDSGFDPRSSADPSYPHCHPRRRLLRDADVRPESARSVRAGVGFAHRCLLGGQQSPRLPAHGPGPRARDAGLRLVAGPRLVPGLNPDSEVGWGPLRSNLVWSRASPVHLLGLGGLCAPARVRRASLSF